MCCLSGPPVIEDARKSEQESRVQWSSTVNDNDRMQSFDEHKLDFILFVVNVYLDRVSEL